MSYKALYRSYRPTSFSEVIGQKHVIQTLKNAIIENRTSHAYVFSGLRGIGKTTIARILAKAVNCENPVNGEPCNCCASCKAINEGTTTDIVELDAASNNGVDEIRNILDKVNFLPSGLKKKVYIIDEVHMLSTAAFNALLKTLEEPPSYVMFILATTEPHKIPMTILSRCQRFDFKQLTLDELKEEISLICTKENIKITEEAVEGIAIAAEGGMRDALSILDQASVYAENEISINDINSVTGNVSNDNLYKLVEAFNNDDANNAINIVNELINSGKEVSRLITCVIQFCRDILLYKSVGQMINQKYLANNDKFIELCDNCDSRRLFYYIDSLIDVQNKIRFTNSQKIYLEVGVMKIVNSATEDIALSERISKLEQALNAQGNISIDYNTYNPDNEARLTLLETKVKKLQTENDNNNFNNFKDEIYGKINILEEATTKSIVLPQAIEERIQILENKTNSIEKDNEVFENVIHSSVQKEDDLESIEKEDASGFNNDELKKLIDKVNYLDEKNTELFNALLDDVKALKEGTISSSNQTNNNQNDDIIMEIIDKVTKIESTIDTNNVTINNRLTKLEQNNNNTAGAQNEETLFTIPADSDEKSSDAKINAIQDEIFNIQSEINEIKNSLYSKKENIEFVGDLFGNDFTDKKDTNITIEANNNLEMKLESYYNSNKADISELREKVDSLSLLYNKKISDENETSCEEQLANNSKGIFENYNDKINALEEQIRNCAPNSVIQSLSDLKTNYYLLAHMIEPINEKVKNLDQGNMVNQLVEDLNQKIEKINIEIIGIKTNSLTEEKVRNIIGECESDNKFVKERSIEKDRTKEIVSEPVKIVTVEEPVYEEPKIKEEPIKDIPAVPTYKEETNDLTSKIYDINIIGRTLKESFDQECKNNKAILVNNWSKITDKVGGVLMNVANILVNGKLVAVGKTHIIIVYPNAQLCNHIMDPKNHEDALEILKTTFKMDIDFIALPERIWQKVRLEYINQYGMGMTPKLSPIEDPELHIIQVVKQPVLTERQKTLKKADEFFGVDDD